MSFGTVLLLAYASTITVTITNGALDGAIIGAFWLLIFAMRINLNGWDNP